MEQNKRDQANVQRAVVFFTQAGLSRLLARLRDKYLELGQVGGQIMLEESTPQERREIASFLGKPPSSGPTLKVRASDVDNALRRSGFACTLPELLAAFFPASALVTRHQRRATQTAYQQAFRDALDALRASLPEAARGRAWLTEGTHGQEWLFSRYKNARPEEQARQLEIIGYIARILDQLSGEAMPQRLALFAQQTSGDPHMLDPNRAAGRLLLLALGDLTHTPLQPGLNREDALRLYMEVGLQVDTISSYVVAFNLASASFQDGTPDPMIAAAGERILPLTLRQLWDWGRVQAATRDIYIIENPQVFEEIIDNQPSTTQAPTIICTAGWPSVAALTLLDKLISATPDSRFHYSGDFDLKGLQIAAHFLDRYPDHCTLWHIDPAAYMLALQVGGVLAPAHELAQLKALPTIFAPLVQALQTHQQWAYQEGIVHLLTAFD
ncbi:hypothetical protein KSD_44770 [Ktedonobacter sp. SOSP1-85]|uniref:TIGR02679 family protein n=1 Tax=Ktedonobacter sp. SOSP1-85 TaxID=2778367 RepID=UPI001914F654|nr:TIGR02679 family protein [Ktedonobacter sp. SOSP1-85]GHO76706.1 hypothetical protein KSD_44770 [Ktedonobacter sp. SOSP1-85]